MASALAAETIETNGVTAAAGDEARNGGSNQICRFFNTKRDCRNGDSCRFRHPVAAPEPESQTAEATPQVPVTTSSEREEPRAAMAAPERSRIVSRPVPKAQTENPRNFQISQIKRRFKAEESPGDDGSKLTFNMPPSDPDFPYEIETLECILSIPESYSNGSRPTLVIRNKDIPQGFIINLQRGFDKIALDAPHATLLSLLNRLDQQLESILSGKKAETVTIISNSAPIKPAAPEAPKDTSNTPVHSGSSKPTFTEQQKAAAKGKRQSDIHQLEARFSRLALFKKSADGSVFTVPLDSPKRSTWPTELQSLRSARITVPELYPLTPLQLHLDVEGQSKAAASVEVAFKQSSAEHSDATITQHINHLSQNLKSMATEARPLQDQPNQTTGPVTQPLRSSRSVTPTVTTSSATLKAPSGVPPEAPKVIHIPRPTEWTQRAEPGEDSDTAGTLSTVDTDESDSDEDIEASEPSDEPTTSSAPAEKGILLSFPHLELHGIELLELVSLNITIKCERCKDIVDVERLRSTAEDSAARNASCKKCASAFAIRFRADMIHANSVRGGYLDLDGCTVVDMLPSQFIPTCSECSTAYPAPGVTAVRGDSAMAICRECHKHLSIRIQEVKFLQISAAAIRASAAPGRKKTRENLGITAGTELPSRGRCSHYKKSYRWFRFSCCGKVFPCDRCHDEQTDHPNEFANRMLCGFCSREQNYRPDDCGICHAALTGKKGRGFWEGGKGTRDPARMSRKDPRKYARRPGTKPKT